MLHWRVQGGAQGTSGAGGCTGTAAAGGGHRAQVEFPHPMTSPQEASPGPGSEDGGNGGEGRLLRPALLTPALPSALMGQPHPPSATSDTGLGPTLPSTGWGAQEEEAEEEEERRGERFLHQ